tara:strand:+ start:225 stop:608 length:384 start_codon:yes stop_codon:yes gene_type:complete
MQYCEVNNKQADIFASSNTRLFKKNQVIYEQEQKTSKIFVILDGTVESFSSNKSKSNFTLQKGSSLGLIDTILERPYSRNIIARSNVSVAIIEKRIIHNILKENPIAAVLIKSLAIDIDNKFPEVWS